MNQDKKPKPYADLRVKVRSYEKDGEIKNVYATIGTLFASPHLSNMYAQIDTLPIGKEWDGRVFVNPRADWQPPEKVKDVLPDDNFDKKPIDFDNVRIALGNDYDLDNKPINPNDIPF